MLTYMLACPFEKYCTGRSGPFRRQLPAIDEAIVRNSRQACARCRENCDGGATQDGDVAAPSRCQQGVASMYLLVVFRCFLFSEKLLFSISQKSFMLH